MSTSLADQVAFHDRYAIQAHNYVYRLCGAEHKTIIHLARTRLIAGHSLYNDRMWRKLEDDLTTDLLEELADATNYAVPIVKRGVEAREKYDKARG